MTTPNGLRYGLSGVERRELRALPTKERIERVQGKKQRYVVLRSHKFRTDPMTGDPMDSAPEDRVYSMTAVTYNTLDAYDSKFVPGSATRYLADNMPRMAWGHDWREPIGIVTDWRDGSAGLDMDFRLDDHPKVPRAQQAAYQISRGTLTDVSIGFMPIDLHVDDDDGSLVFDEIEIDEVSIVLAGAVPGAVLHDSRVLRAATGDMIRSEQAAEIVAQLSCGAIDLHEALGQVKAYSAVTTAVTTGSISGDITLLSTSSVSDDVDDSDDLDDDGDAGDRAKPKSPDKDDDDGVAAELDEIFGSASSVLSELVF